MLLAIAVGGVQAQHLNPAAPTDRAMAPPFVLRGAGATFPYPIYYRWFARFDKQRNGVKVEYQAIGSGGGIAALRAKTVDFAATDAPLTPQEQAALPLPVKQIPTAGRVLAVIYNLPGVGTGLRLTPQIIADIYLGKIRRWRDARIRSLNPDRQIPDLPVTPFHRIDGSGDTYLFTHFLSKVSTEWISSPGSGRSVQWPIGYGAGHGPGVGGMVRGTPGGIGYEDFAYAIGNRYTYAAIRNRAARYVLPGVASGDAALLSVADALNRDVTASTVDAPGANSYPICGLTYVIIPQTGRPSARQTARLWSWAMQPAQQAAVRAFYFIPLPLPLARHNMVALSTVFANRAWYRSAAFSQTTTHQFGVLR
jgi:phosphate transport system substrate-binding protein